MKEKDYIEEMIETNLEALNDNEPMEGHFARFEEKLKKQHRAGRFGWKTVLKVAAAVVFVLLATNQAFIYLSSDGQGILKRQAAQREITLASVSAEYGEAEYYYRTSIEAGLEQWNSLVADGIISEQEQATMSEEFEEFEQRYQSLQKDLAANPNDERVINAMLEVYRGKLAVINMIVNKLEEVKQQKNTSYENL